MPKTKNKQIAMQAMISTFFAFLAIFIAPARIFVITHSIDKETYGYFSLLTITLNSLGFVGILGLRYYLIYAFPHKSTKDQGSIFNSSLCVNLLTGPLAGLLFVIITLFVVKTIAFTPLIIGLGFAYIIIYTIANLGLGYLLAVGRVALYKFLSFMTSYFWFFTICILLVFVKAGSLPDFNLLGLTLTILLSLIAVFLIITIFTYKFLGKEGISAKPSFALAKKSVFYGFPLLPQYFALALFRLADRYVILDSYGPETVATYTVAATLVFFSADTQMLLEYIFPHMSDAWKENLNNKLHGFKGQAAKYFYSALRLSLFMTIPMGIGIMLWGTTLIELLAGENYICPELKYLFWIMSPLVVIMPLAKMFQFTINLDNKTKFVGISVLIASLLNLVLNILFIPKYGLLGAAGATSFSYTLLFISSVFMSSTKHDFKISQLRLVQILTSAIVMSITVFIVRYFVDDNLSTYFSSDRYLPRIFIEAPLAGAAYCICSLKLKVWKFSELTGK